MRRKKTRYSKKHKALRDMILEGMLSSKKFFIKDTGVEIEIERFDEDTYDRFLDEKFSISIVMLGTPTIQAIDKLESYDIRKRTTSTGISGKINLENISLTPFEGAASQVLYSNKK